jgi:hypothetical protein
MASFSSGAVHIDLALLQQQTLEGLRQKYRLVRDDEFLMEFMAGSMTSAVHKLRKPKA